MIQLTRDEIAACRLDQFRRVTADYLWRESPRCCISGRLRKKTRYHLVLRPLARGRLRLLLAATREVGGEVRGVAEWLVGDPAWRLNPTCDFYGALAGWITDWKADPRKAKDLRIKVGRMGGKHATAPLWPWASLANDGAAIDTPWEWIARAARTVEEKKLPDYFAAARTAPRVELLARAGLNEAWFRPGALRALEADEELRRVVAQNAERIASERLLPRDLLYGRRRGWSFEQTARHAALRTCWHGCPTYGVDLEAAERYVGWARHDPRCPAMALGLHVTRREYSEYCDNARQAGLDLARREVAFPRDFDGAFKRAEEAAHRKRREEARRAQAAAIAKLTPEEIAAMRRRRAEAEARRRAERIKRKEALRQMAPRLRTAATFAAVALKRMPLPDGWRVRPIRTVAEFRAEGERMHNCIGTGTYAEKVAQGRAICFAIEGPTPADRHDLELALGKSPRVVQLYGVCNRPPVDVAREIASRVVVAIREAQPKDAEAATEWRAAQ